MTDRSVSTPEAVHAPIDENLAEELLAFWTRLGALTPEQGRERLKEVLCVVRDAGGNIVGVNSAAIGRVAELGDQVFHIYRSLLDQSVHSPDQWREMLVSACGILDSLAVEGRNGGAIGMVVPIADGNLQCAWSEAFWPETGLVHAGFLAGGVQVRLRYYPGARIQVGAGA